MSLTPLFARLNEQDKYGEVLVPGAIGIQEVFISPFEHGLWGGELPIGIGETYETDEYVGVKGKFNLEMTNGKDTYECVKMSGLLQEWSYGFFPVYEKRMFAGSMVPHIVKAYVKEVSPVFMGAGNETMTLCVKSAPTELPDLWQIFTTRNTR